MIERSYCGYDFGKNQLHQIITTIDLMSLNFDGFLSFILYEIQSNVEYIQITVKIG